MREPAEWPERVDRDLVDQDDRALTAATNRRPVGEPNETTARVVVTVGPSMFIFWWQTWTLAAALAVLAPGGDTQKEEAGDWLLKP